MTEVLTTPDVDTTVLDDLDFDVPCGVKNATSKTECGNLADWWVIAAAHCIPDATRSGFMCDNHFNRLMAGHLFRCNVCGNHDVWLDRVIRTERIR